MKILKPGDTVKNKTLLTLAAIAAGTCWMIFFITGGILIVKMATRPPQMSQQEVDAQFIGKNPQEVEELLGKPTSETLLADGDKGDATTYRYDRHDRFIIVLFHMHSGDWKCESIRCYPKKANRLIF